MTQLFRPPCKPMRPAPLRPLLTPEALRHRQPAASTPPAAGTVDSDKRPFVLRAAVGEVITTEIFNLLADTPLCLAVVDDDYGILEDEGVEIAPGESRTLTWHCRHTGIYPIYNRACRDAAERRTLFGVLIIDAA